MNEKKMGYGILDFIKLKQKFEAVDVEFDDIKNKINITISYDKLITSPRISECGNCKYWQLKEVFSTREEAALKFDSIDKNDWGVCHNKYTYSNVRGDSFEPPRHFGCNNFSEKI